MRDEAQPRSILHVDLDPFFVSVERALDPALRGRPLIVGGEAGPLGLVAAASHEARDEGVRPGQSLRKARALCPGGVFRPGDLEAYARVSEEVTAILLATSRRVERPSSDEAYVDLSAETPTSPKPVQAAEQIKDELQRRLGLDASLGLGTSRLAARVASRWARPRGLLVVLPGYELSFLARQPVSALYDLPPHLERALLEGGLSTLGAIANAEPDLLAAAVGSTAAPRIQEAAQGRGEEPVTLAAPPSWIQEEARIRSPRPDRESLAELIDGLAERACRRLRPFALFAGAMTLEVRRGHSAQRRSESFQPGIADAPTLRSVARSLAQPLLDPPSGVRALGLRLSRMATAAAQAPLFPDLPGIAR